MKKFSWLIALFVVLAISMAFVACSNGTDDPPPPPPPTEFSFEGPFVYNLWGGDTTQPTLNNDGTLTFVANSSSGFSITFASMGYTFNANDVLEFTYWVEVETPKAVFSLKNPAAWNDHMPAPATWGIGMGREYVLGDAELSVYDAESPRIVAGTWDPETSTGTFEVRMSLFPSNATAIGFQHNVWANFDGLVAENSEYTFKFISVKNNVAAPLATAPEITTQPGPSIINLVVGEDDIPSLTVVASAAPTGETRTYQWEREDDDEWTAIAGATTATLALAAHIEDAEEEGTWKFRVVVTNKLGESVAFVNSNVVTVNVAATAFDYVAFWTNVITLLELEGEPGNVTLTSTENGIRVSGRDNWNHGVLFTTETINALMGSPGASGDGGHITDVYYETEHGGSGGQFDDMGGTYGFGSARALVARINANNHGQSVFAVDTSNNGDFYITDIRIATTAGWAEHTAVSIFTLSQFELP